MQRRVCGARATKSTQRTATASSAQAYMIDGTLILPIDSDARAPPIPSSLILLSSLLLVLFFSVSGVVWGGVGCPSGVDAARSTKHSRHQAAICKADAGRAIRDADARYAMYDTRTHGRIHTRTYLGRGRRGKEERAEGRKAQKAEAIEHR